MLSIVDLVRQWLTMAETMLDRGRRGRPLSTMVDHDWDHGRPWSTMVNKGRPWSTVIYYGRPRRRCSWLRRACLICLDGLFDWRSFLNKWDDSVHWATWVVWVRLGCVLCSCCVLRWSCSDFSPRARVSSVASRAVSPLLPSSPPPPVPRSHCLWACVRDRPPFRLASWACVRVHTPLFPSCVRCCLSPCCFVVVCSVVFVRFRWFG